ncbi:MAG: ATP-grasp domain-containing protein [Lachnospiraceae bacterium]
MEAVIGLIAGKSGDSLTDELHKKGYLVALICGKKDEPGSDTADYVGYIDMKNHKEIIDFFSSLEVKKVIIGTGHRLAFELVMYLEAAGFITNINLEKSKLAKNKWLFKEEIQKIGIKTPKATIYKHGIISDYLDINYPSVLKAINDSFLPVKVNNIQELKNVIDEFSDNLKETDLLVEQYIDGYDCTVAVLNDGHKVEHLGVTYYSKAKEYSLMGFSDAKVKEFDCDMERKICNIASKIVSDLAFVGLVRVDFIIDSIDETIYVLELNSVVVTGYHGSSYPFFKKQGINIANKYIETALALIGE